MAQMLAAGASANVAEDRRRLEELRTQRAEARVASKRPLPVGDPPALTVIACANGAGKITLISRNPALSPLPLLAPDRIRIHPRSSELEYNQLWGGGGGGEVFV